LSDTPENPIAVYLRQMDEKLNRFANNLADIGRQVTSLETRFAFLHSDFAARSHRINRIDLHLERIERRLNIAHA
jgi:hypothetical protein